MLLCAAGTVSAQQFLFHGYGQGDGLGNLSVTCLAQDHAGYLWVCTENGMYRHDASEFRRFGERAGLRDTDIHAAVVDGAGRLWVGTSHDLYLYDGQRFTAVRPDGRALSLGSGSRLAPLPDNRLLVLDKQGLLELWLDPTRRSWRARSFFDARQLQATPALEQLSGVYADSKGRVWLGCATRICSVEQDRVSSWSTARGVPEDDWRSWVLDAQGRLWARGLKHVVALDSGAARFVDKEAPHARLTSDILNVPLIDDGQGSIVTRTDLGLARWRADHWEETTLENGLPTAAIAALLVTRDGSMWLGMSGNGLARWLGYETFESWTAKRGLDRNPVWAIVRGFDHTITMGTRQGCLHLDARRSAQPCAFEGLPPGEIQVMARDEPGNLWIGTATGPLYRVAAGARRAVRVADVALMRKLFVDSVGRLWICTNSGVRVVQPGSTELTAELLPAGLGEVTDITQDDEGTLWIATQGGLLRRTENGWSLLRLPIAAASGFASVVSAGHGWLWASGASHGLMRLHVTGGQADIALWQTDLNVVDAAVNFTLVDRRGWLWLGTDSGVVVYDGQSWRKFDQQDGLIWNDTDQNSVYADEDGSVWIGTSGGLAHVLRPGALVRATSLDLRIGRLTVGGQRLAARPVVWQPELSLDVQLQELDFFDPKETLLKVRLRGLSDDWFPTQDFNVHYPALAPGHYTFEAVAANPDLQSTSAIVRQEFEILPPWWQTTRFRMLAALVLLAAVAGVWRWSVLKSEARRRSLERELREREILLERATRDPLTRLWNRQAILEILAREMTAAEASQRPLAIALIDIDHFKRVNDTMGHLMGDEVLRAMSEHISKQIRGRDSLGRYGGEELLLVLPEASPQRPYLPMERLQRTVAEITFVHNDVRFNVTASFGVAWFAAGEDTVEDLIGRADAALYAAKHLGRDRVEYAATGT